MEHVIEHTGPYIDVFPLDYVPGKFSVGQWLQGRKVKFLRYMLFYRSRALKKPANNRKKLIAYYASFFANMKMIQKMIDGTVRKYNYTSNKRYMVNYASYYNHIDQTMPSFVYGDPIYVDFEGYKLPVPQHYDYVLTSIYGEYHKLPPKSKRKNKHRFYMDVGGQ